MFNSEGTQLSRVMRFCLASSCIPVTRNFCIPQIAYPFPPWFLYIPAICYHYFDCSSQQHLHNILWSWLWWWWCSKSFSITINAPRRRGGLKKIGFWLVPLVLAGSECVRRIHHFKCDDWRRATLWWCFGCQYRLQILLLFVRPQGKTLHNDELNKCILHCFGERCHNEPHPQHQRSIATGDSGYIFDKPWWSRDQLDTYTVLPRRNSCRVL